MANNQTSKKSFFIYFFLYFSVLVTLFFATGCGNQIKDLSNNSNNTNIAPINPGTFNPGTLGSPENINTPYDQARECQNVIENSSKPNLINAMEALMFRSITNIEGISSICIDAESSELTNFDASIRFEYEDDVGVRSLDFTRNELIYSSRRNNKIHLLFLDGAGYVEIKGTRNSSGVYTATIRLANLPTQSSYYDELNDWLDDLHNFCSASPAKCIDLVYIPSQPNYYPSQSRAVSDAQIYLNGGRGADNYTLGTVRFTL